MGVWLQKIRRGKRDNGCYNRKTQKWHCQIRVQEETVTRKGMPVNSSNSTPVILKEIL